MPVYTPKQPKFTGAMPKTVADSPLCHVSVGKWMKAANKDLGSADRKDRCARLTASIAFQTVTLLNQWKDGKYKTKGIIPAKGYGIQSQHKLHGLSRRQGPVAACKESVTGTSVRKGGSDSPPFREFADSMSWCHCERPKGARAISL